MTEQKQKLLDTYWGDDDDTEKINKKKVMKFFDEEAFDNNDEIMNISEIEDGMENFYSSDNANIFKEELKYYIYTNIVLSLDKTFRKILFKKSRSRTQFPEESKWYEMGKSFTGRIEDFHIFLNENLPENFQEVLKIICLSIGYKKESFNSNEVRVCKISDQQITNGNKIIFLLNPNPKKNRIQGQTIIIYIDSKYTDLIKNVFIIQNFHFYVYSIALKWFISQRDYKEKTCLNRDLFKRFIKTDTIEKFNNIFNGALDYFYNIYNEFFF